MNSRISGARAGSGLETSSGSTPVVYNGRRHTPKQKITKTQSLAEETAVTRPARNGVTPSFGTVSSVYASDISASPQRVVFPSVGGSFWGASLDRCEKTIQSNEFDSRRDKRPGTRGEDDE